jgi:hypothetical protein
MLRALTGLVIALALSACSPSAETKPTESDATRANPQNPFFGTWELTRAKIAPWWTDTASTPEPDPAFTKFTLAADKSSGPPLLTCDKPRYANNLVPVRGLFQGNLPEPEKNAADLGFTSPDVTTTSFTCQTGNADVEVDFAMQDDNTILMALDNVIYTFGRTGN